MKSRLTGTLVLLGGVLALTIFGVFRTVDTPGTARAMVERSVAVETVETLRIEGSWDVVVVGTDDGDGAQLVVDGRAGDGFAEAVERDGTTVTLTDWGIGGRRRAVLTGGGLSVVEIEGAANIRLDGGTYPDLALRIDGVGRVDAEDMVVDRLDVETDGAARVDFSAATVGDARVNIDGAALVELTMSGGTLTGTIDGAGRVRYEGTVSVQEVEIDGIGSVEGPGR